MMSQALSESLLDLVSHSVLRHNEENHANIFVVVLSTLQARYLLSSSYTAWLLCCAAMSSLFSLPVSWPHLLSLQACSVASS